MATLAGALTLDRISKRYGDVVAVDDASMFVGKGTVHALLGENGAGKTSLMRVAYGMTKPDRGQIIIGGVECTLHTPFDAIRAGVGMVHQHFTLVPSMTVRENLALGGRGILNARDMTMAVEDASARTGFRLDSMAPVSSLSVGAQQRLEIAKAIARNPDVLILDEPTAVLTPDESADLLEWLERYAADGHAVVLITHKLREALSISDDVTVMRGGRTVLSVPASEVDENDLTVAMLGERLEVETSRLTLNTPTGVAFSADSLVLANVAGRIVIDRADFQIAFGEIVGIAAVEGAGQHELLAALAGRLAPVSGELRKPNAVGYVAEDRHADGVLLDRDLAENVALRGAGSRAGLMDWKEWRTRTEQLMKTFDVRAPDSGTPMRALSGGNQQKLVVARELDTRDTHDRRAIIADNPTRGLDVRAAAAIHRRLRAAAEEGAAVVLYSSDLDEVLAHATRILVLHGGTIREIARDRMAVGRAMLGAS